MPPRPLPVARMKPRSIDRGAGRAIRFGGCCCSHHAEANAPLCLVARES